MSRRLLQSIQPKISWKTVAVQGKTANDFATRLEKELNDLANAGYGLAMSFQRRDALILVGQKMERPTNEELQRLLNDGEAEMLVVEQPADPSKLS